MRLIAVIVFDAIGLHFKREVFNISSKIINLFTTTQRKRARRTLGTLLVDTIQIVSRVAINSTSKSSLSSRGYNSSVTVGSRLKDVAQSTVASNAIRVQLIVVIHGARRNIVPTVYVRFVHSQTNVACVAVQNITAHRRRISIIAVQNDQSTLVVIDISISALLINNIAKVLADIDGRITRTDVNVVRLQRIAEGTGDIS